MATGTPATVLLTRLGIAYTVRSYDHDPRMHAYGDEAATKLGVEPGRLFKTLIVSVDDALVCAVVPVSGQLSLKALAAAVGGRKATMADPGVAARATGYVVGGISPLAHRRPLPVVLDSSAADFDTVYVSAGRRGLQVELSPDDLVRATRATTARIAAP